MSVNINVAAQNIFKSRCPKRTICCPVHEKLACVKYIQPPRPQSCKPLLRYNGPEFPLEGDTVYHLSYQGVGRDTARACRPDAVTVRGNIGLPCGPLENSTTTGLSYMWTWQTPPEPYRPKSLYTPPTGPMQNTTTQRHDFPAKPPMRPEMIIPQGNIAPICAKMEDRTVAMESYLPAGRPDPPQSCKPIQRYEGPQQPLENTTVTQLSYLPPEMGPRETPPWALRREYFPPDAAMEGDTIYNGSFLPPGNFEPCDTETPLSGERCLCKFATATEDL